MGLFKQLKSIFGNGTRTYNKVPPSTVRYIRHLLTKKFRNNEIVRRVESKHGVSIPSSSVSYYKHSM